MTPKPKLNAAEFFIKDGMICANVMDEDGDLICYDEQPLDFQNPQHQSLARLLDTLGIQGNPHRRVRA